MLLCLLRFELCDLSRCLSCHLPFLPSDIMLLLDTWNLRMTYYFSCDFCLCETLLEMSHRMTIYNTKQKMSRPRSNFLHYTRIHVAYGFFVFLYDLTLKGVGKVALFHISFHISVTPLSSYAPLQEYIVFYRDLGPWQFQLELCRIKKGSTTYARMYSQMHSKAN